MACYRETTQGALDVAIGTLQRMRTHVLAGHAARMALERAYAEASVVDLDGGKGVAVVLLRSHAHAVLDHHLWGEYVYDTLDALGRDALVRVVEGAERAARDLVQVLR